jgi:hypothetical protein
VDLRAMRHLRVSLNALLGLLCIPLALVSHGRLAVIDGALELHGRLIALLLRRCTLTPGGASAMTLGHVVLGRDGPALAVTRQHERVHVRQCEAWGPAFIPALPGRWGVGLAEGRGAYRGNYFERRAVQEASQEYLPRPLH